MNRAGSGPSQPRTALLAILKGVDNTFSGRKRIDDMGIETAFPQESFVTTQLNKVVNWARKSSLWPMPFATACCGIELMATGASRHDLARFGAEVMRFSPRQSDLLLVAGRVAIKMMPVLQRIYQQMPQPKWVISMGACASSGGVFDTYAVVQGIDQFIPVDVYVPGCPPRPETLLEGIMAIQQIVDNDGQLPSDHPRRPLQIALQPTHKVSPQPVPLTISSQFDTPTIEDATKGNTL